MSPSLMSERERKYQFFETPPHYTAALLGEVSVWGRVFEPCVGDGAISSAIRKLPSVGRVITNDIDRSREADYHVDASMAWPEIKADWAITNPPFSQELEILECAIDATPNVAFLARLSFLEPTEDRAYFLEAHPPTQMVVLPRHSFRLNDEGKRATDSVTCAWLIWTEDKAPRGISAWGRGKSQAYAIVRDLWDQ